MFPHAPLAGPSTCRVAPDAAQGLPTQARAFARHAHGAQRYGDRPYIWHLDAVADIVRQHTDDPAVVAAAYLHGVLEDVRSVYPTAIVRAFGARTARIVEAVTKAPGDAYELTSYLRGIRAAGPEAVLVKVADRLANMTMALLVDTSTHHARKYLGEYPVFRALLYRRGEHEALWAKLDQLVAD